MGCLTLVPVFFLSFSILCYVLFFYTDLFSEGIGKIGRCGFVDWFALVVCSMADMYKSQLQELAQRSCFNLPSYACIREGPDHAPRFKASVNFNGEIFESPSYRTTLRKAEHAAAEVALNVLSTRGPSRSLTARILDETGVYKNLLQETAHRTGLNVPVYTTIRSGPGHVPVFTSTVELAGMSFTGESAKTKKQAEKNAAIAAWSALKKMPNLGSVSQTTSKETDNHEHHQDEAVVARVLSNFRPNDENKPIRRRDDQNQTRRGIMNWGHSRDNGLNTCLQNHLWRPMDLLMDSSSEGPKQKQKSFVSLLPPPPPRTTSKILQTTSSSRDSSSFYQYSTDNRPSNMIQLRGQYSQVKMQEVPPPPPLDGHQKDEDEWLSGKSDDVMIKKPLFLVEEEEDSELQGANCMYRPFALANKNKNNNTGKHNTLAPHQYTTQDEQSHMRSRLVGPPMAVTSIKTPTCHHMGRTVHIGGYNPQRIAPAVHIRSVIPVCATPSSQPAVRPQQPSMKELGVSASTTTPMSTHTAGGGGAEVSSSSTPTLFNKLLQVNKTQLSSEFNNKLQLRRN